jgi:uncharacterized membrane protein YqaE (UPF0057 family)
MRNQLQLVSAILIVITVFTSCSRNYHIEFAGRYHPDTKAAIAKNEHQQRTPANVNSMPKQEADVSAIASENSEQEVTTSATVQKQSEYSYSLTPAQEKKANRIIDKIEKKAAKKEITWQAPSLPSSDNNFNDQIKKHSADEDQLLFAIISFFIPPLGVALYEEDITVHFWIDLLLTLLFWLPGFIYALVIILGD